MGKKGFARRMLAVILSLCCVLGMFPTAGAVPNTETSSSETKTRYVWLVSQPGIQLKVQARGGKPTLWTRNMGDANTAWYPMHKVTDPQTGEKIYVADPTTSEYIGIGNVKMAEAAGTVKIFESALSKNEYSKIFI